MADFSSTIAFAALSPQRLQSAHLRCNPGSRRTMAAAPLQSVSPGSKTIAASESILRSLPFLQPVSPLEAP